MTRQLTTAAVDRLFDIAARAPSARNTQPWLPAVTEIDGSAAGLRIRVDAERTLPVGDPHGAGLGMSLGCWVEACAIAAAEQDLQLCELSVTGQGQKVEVGARLVPAAGDDVSAEFTVAEVVDRQVDRGRLAADAAAVEAAVAEYAALRPQAVADRTAHGELHRQTSGDAASGIVIAQVPEAVWVKAARYAQAAPYEPREALDETLEWLRFDPHDPRISEDGLSAEALRIPRPLARTLSRLAGTGTARGAVSDAVQQRIRDILVTAGAYSTMLPTFPSRRAPVRLALAIEAAHMSEVPAERWVLLGRELMRLWLVMARHGLRVDVSSELTEVPLSAAMLADVLRRTAPVRAGEKPAYVPFTAFSVGRSTGPVPRSPRLR